MSTPLPIDNDDAWEPWRKQWNLRADTLYLNHGSFGPPPAPVRAAQRRWKERLDEQPMDFFVRQYEPAWFAARESLARFVNTVPDNLVFVENATDGMNVIADSLSLAPGDEVLLTEHEYGAVLRIWKRACHAAGTVPPVIAELPLPFENTESVVDALFAKVNDRTKLIVVSHVTSPTAVVLPVAEVCRRAKALGIAVCIDGAHAPVQVPLDIAALDCDYYTATCHKWMCAPAGSAFLFVAPKWQSKIRAPSFSWGRLPPHSLDHWYDEFVWSGTRDPSSYFTVPTAIEFLESVGLESFRARTHWLASYARRSLLELFQIAPIYPDTSEWYGSMTLVPLPPATDCAATQLQLWQQFGIEVPLPVWNGRPAIRVSCHLYNRCEDIDRLVAALCTVLKLKGR